MALLNSARVPFSSNDGMAVNREGWHVECPLSRAELIAAGGSLVVCLLTPHAVYVSADSRYHSPGGSVDDSGRKLILCGENGLCGLSGQLRFTRAVSDRVSGELLMETSFDLIDVVAGVDSADGGSGLHGQAFGDEVYRALLPLWAKFGSGLDAPFGISPFNGSTESGLPLAQILHIHRFSSGQVFVDRIDLKHSIRQLDENCFESVLIPPSVRSCFSGCVDMPIFLVLGSAACGRPEPLRRGTRDDADAVEILEGIFEQGIRDSRCAASVGGPIDIAVINDSGRKWLRQKSVNDAIPG